MWGGVMQEEEDDEEEDDKSPEELERRKLELERELNYSYEFDVEVPSEVRVAQGRTHSLKLCAPSHVQFPLPHCLTGCDRGCHVMPPNLPRGSASDV